MKTTGKRKGMANEELKKQLQNLEHLHMRNTIEFLDALKHRFGQEVVSTVDKVVAERTNREWTAIAENLGTNTLDDLIRTLWSSKLRSRGYKFKIERSETGVSVLCTRCPVHELARELGATEWMNHLVCKGDPHIVEGFNPKLGFRHIKSLMEGQDCCQQLYFNKD
jgi:predicted ArsR family transcriptional regulator